MNGLLGKLIAGGISGALAAGGVVVGVAAVVILPAPSAAALDAVNPVRVGLNGHPATAASSRSSRTG